MKITSQQEGIIKLARTHSDYYLKNQSAFIKMLTDETIVFTVMMSAYKALVQKEDIKRIEDLPENEKWDLYRKVKEWCPTASKEKNTDLCKCFHALTFLIKEKATAETVASNNKF